MTAENIWENETHNTNASPPMAKNKKGCIKFPVNLMGSCLPFSLFQSSPGNGHQCYSYRNDFTGLIYAALRVCTDTVTIKSHKKQI